MICLKRAFRYLLHDQSKFLDSLIERINFLFSDKVYLSLRYRLKMGSWIDWDNPRLFTEKIQWLKLYGFKRAYTTLVDKLAVKAFVAKKIGSEYVIPLLGVWDDLNEIDWNSLPNQFVLKTTHGGGNGGVVICKDKSSFSVDKAKKKLSASLKTDVGSLYREKPYNGIPKKIIAEKFIDDSENKELNDYKFFCFNGSPLYCQVIRDRTTKETIDFYDMQWNHMPFTGLNPDVGMGDSPVCRPEKFEKMIELCKILAENMPFVRVDLYNIHGQIYFGELTFYPASGFGRFSPTEWNNKFGEHLKLPSKQI